MPSVACVLPLHQDLDKQIVNEHHYEAAAFQSLRSRSISPLAQQSEARTSIVEEEEWEIRKSVSKRRAGEGCEYRIR